MNEPVHPVKQCASVGHVYCSITVVRCLHLEAWTADIATWVDTADDETLELSRERIEFGPFDSYDEVRRLVGELGAAAMATVELHGSV